MLLAVLIILKHFVAFRRTNDNHQGYTLHNRYCISHHSHGKFLTPSKNYRITNGHGQKHNLYLWLGSNSGQTCFCQTSDYFSPRRESSHLNFRKDDIPIEFYFEGTSCNERTGHCRYNNKHSYERRHRIRLHAVIPRRRAIHKRNVTPNSIPNQHRHHGKHLRAGDDVRQENGVGWRRVVLAEDFTP
mmetsp:Transcript_25258/g.30533  ORF Transcript_25258/g.30533 Transcript_25258/m.30533 type:complete len:187 (+) Transcript_25258:114-674(+)